MKKICVIIFLLISKITFACSCVTVYGDSNFLKAATISGDVIFSGKVISIDSTLFKNEYGIEFYKKKVILSVDYIYKKMKKTKRRKITVVTDGSNNDCSYPFAMGKKYLVFADDVYYANTKKKEHFLYVSICTDTTLYSKEKEELLKKKLCGD